jgi:hypothetical protein
MTDGQISEGLEADEVISLVNKRSEQLEANVSRKITIFTFSLGHQAHHHVTKTIACNIGGIWTLVAGTYVDLISAMSAYYKLFALGLGVGDNENFAAWVEPYEFYTRRGVMRTAVSVPMYDRSVTPPLFLGWLRLIVTCLLLSRFLEKKQPHHLYAAAVCSTINCLLPQN